MTASDKNNPLIGLADIDKIIQNILFGHRYIGARAIPTQQKIPGPSLSYSLSETMTDCRMAGASLKRWSLRPLLKFETGKSRLGFPSVLYYSYSKITTPNLSSKSRLPQVRGAMEIVVVASPVRDNLQTFPFDGSIQGPKNFVEQGADIFFLEVQIICVPPPSC